MGVKITIVSQGNLALYCDDDDDDKVVGHFGEKSQDVGRPQPDRPGYGVRLGSGPRTFVGGHGFQSSSVIEPFKTYPFALSMIRWSTQTPKHYSKRGPLFESALPYVLECAQREPKA